MMVLEQPVDDSDLLRQVAHGDKRAMREIYMRHSDAVQRFVRSRIRDHFEAADVVHNTMMDVWRSAGRFEGRSSVRSWILTMARNKAVDHIRKQARVTLGEADETVPDDSPTPEAVVAASQDAAKVRDCVSKLGRHQRAAIQLAFFEDMTYPEIAEIEGVPEGTIKTRIFHAKKLLMRCVTR